MTYEERKQEKIERYKELATKARMQSESAYEASNRAVSAIPFGQPILVGHHSESTHRRAIQRSHSAMDRSLKLSDKAEYYEQKAKNLENHAMISSDDPDAIDQLKAKVKKLEDQRERIKQKNKELRSQGKDTYPGYVLSNLGNNIRSVKQRIQLLEKRKSIKPQEFDINGIKIQIDPEDNRVKMFFDGKPSSDVRTTLKRSGFRWSPRNGCWQAFLKQWNIIKAKEIAGEYNE